jgi:hypothetical protein
MLNAIDEQLCEQSRWDFTDLHALYINYTLKRSPEVSNTQGLADRSIAIFERNGASVEVIRAIDRRDCDGRPVKDPEESRCTATSARYGTPATRSITRTPSTESDSDKGVRASRSS